MIRLRRKAKRFGIMKNDDGLATVETIIDFVRLWNLVMQIGWIFSRSSTVLYFYAYS